MKEFQSDILISAIRSRAYFDPTNKVHLSELKFFLTNRKWKNGCPFFLEDPFLEIPTMCVQKYITHALDKIK